MCYLLLAIMSLLLSACAVTTSTLESDPTQLAARQIEVRQLEVPYDIAYRAATQSMFSLGYKIDHSDKISGILSGCRMVDVQAAKAENKQKRALSMVPYVGIFAAMSPTSEAISLQVTMYLHPAGEKCTQIRFKMQVDGEPAWDPVVIDKLWVTTEREVMIETGPSPTSVSTSQPPSAAAPQSSPVAAEATVTQPTASTPPESSTSEPQQ